MKLCCHQQNSSLSIQDIEQLHQFDVDVELNSKLTRIQSFINPYNTTCKQQNKKPILVRSVSSHLSKPLMTIIFIAVILIAIPMQINCIQSMKSVQQAAPAKKVIQANHFYSETDLTATYNIANVEKSRSLIFVLRNKTSTPTSLPPQQNNINITLSINGEKQSHCKFTSYDDLCVIQKVQQDLKNMTLGLACSRTPCDLSWTIFQPLVKHTGSDGSAQLSQQQQPLQQLFHMNDTAHHMIGIVSCNNPQLTKTPGEFADAVMVYSDNDMSVTKNKDVIYYLFNNEKKGFMFAQVKEKFKACARLSIYNVADTIGVKAGEEGTSINSVKDFVTSDSASIFKLKQTPKTDFLLDISMHELDKQKIVKGVLEIRITGENTEAEANKRQLIEQRIIKPFGKKKTFEFMYIIGRLPHGKYKNLQIQFKSIGGIQNKINQNNNIIMINFAVVIEDRHAVNMGEISYFKLTPNSENDKIMYKFEGNPQGDPEKKAKIFVSNTTRLKSSESECSIKNGCEFEVKLIGDKKDPFDGTVYLGLNSDQKKRQDQLIYKQVKQTVTKRGRQGQRHLYKTPLSKLQKSNAFQLVVNSPNVIIYAATPQHCPGEAPSKQCYQKVLNMHHPMIYEPILDLTAKDIQKFLYLSVEILDDCQYTIRRINQDNDLITLKEGESFSYLMDDQEQQLAFAYTVTDKNQPVHFNLISPLNSLYLLVENGKRLPNPKQMNIASTDGFISFEKKEIKSDEFRVLVLKTQENRKKFVHFTIIVSTSQVNLRLEPGVAHYETIQAEQHRDFAFEFHPKQEYIVSFYTHNVKAATDKMSLQLLVSNKDQWKNIPEEQSFIIDRQSDALQLKDISEALCSSSGQLSCQIFLRISNPMDQEVDLTINLMVKGSIIQLKDGIWQSYAENAIATSSNFYFYPKHANKSIQIMYKSVFTDLRIAYVLWKADDKNINPMEWPWPNEKNIIKSNEKGNIFYKPTKHISIDHSALQRDCWPSCVVLISLLKTNPQKDDVTNLQQQGMGYPYNQPILQNGQFSIMASNSYIEIPQKTRLDIVLKQNQTKYFMLDLKYALDKQDSALTIFTYTTIGFYDLKGNVYSQRNPRCPIDDGQSDFRFGNFQTQIKMSTIQQKLIENNIDQDRNIYICLLAKAYTNTKMSFEYTSDEEIIKTLDMDSFETVVLDGKKKKQSEADGIRKNDNPKHEKDAYQKIFQLSAWQQYYIKFTRSKGFPFVDITKCQENADYQKCLTRFKSSQDRGKQIVTKTQSFSEQPCTKCIILVKISAQEPAQIDIHLQSKYTEVQLKEGRIMSDFTNENEGNKYLITALRKEDTIINIQVTEGDVQVHLTDFGAINITKRSKGGSGGKTKSQSSSAVKGEEVSDSSQSTNLLHIVIPAQQRQILNKKAASLQENPNTPQIPYSNLGTQWMSSFGLSDTFVYIHMTIKSAKTGEGSGATAYSVTYSSGQPETFLQDGLITDYTLQPSKETVFYYQNKNRESHAYLYISMINSAQLHNLQFKIFYFVDQEDKDTAIEITPQQPPMRKKTPNPSMLYALPAQKLFVFKTKSVSSQPQRLSIGINHQQVMLLPFDHQFPFPLHKQQSINFLIDVNNPGYLKLTLRKCDQSNPQFSYTFDYEGFQAHEFTYSSVLNDDPHFEIYIKAKDVGTLYVSFKAEEDDDSLMSIRAEYSPEKIKQTVYKAGNKGLVEYQLLDSTTAELVLTQVICSGSSAKDCSSSKNSKEFDYYTISATRQQSLYTQTVCPAHYFSMSAEEDTTSISPLPLTKIKANPDINGKIIFQYTLLEHISYVGVKAINKKTAEQIYYRPVEIVTIWGQISRTSTTHKLTITVASALGLLVLLVWWRRRSRVGYQPLKEED